MPILESQRVLQRLALDSRAPRSGNGRQHPHLSRCDDTKNLNVRSKRMEDFEVPVESSSGSFDSPVNSKVHDLCAKNAQLKLDLTTTKSLLDRALSITPELEAAHAQNRKLISDISEANQRCESLQSRLRMAQIRTVEQDAKERETLDALKRLEKANESLAKAQEEARKENESLKKQCSEAKEREEAACKEMKAFLQHIAQLTGVTVCNLENVASVIAALKTKSADTTASAECEKCREHQDVIVRLVGKCKKAKKQVKCWQEEICRRENELRAAEQKINAMTQAAKRPDDEQVRLKQANAAFEAEVHALKRRNQGLKKEMAAKDEVIKTLKAKVLTQAMVERSVDQTDALRAKINDLEAEKAAMETSLRDKENAVRELQAVNGKLKCKLKSVRREKNYDDTECVHEIRKMKEEKRQYQAQVSELQLKIADYSEQLRNIETQIEIAQSGQVTRKATIEAMTKEMSKMRKVQDLIGQQADRQRAEIADLNSERQRLILMLHKQNQIIAKATALAEAKDEQARKALEKTKVPQCLKPISQEVYVSPLSMLKDILIPVLDEDMKNEVQKILMGAAFEKDKLQRICVFIGDVVKRLRAEINAKEQEILAIQQRKCSKCEEFRTTMRRVMCSFQAAQSIEGAEISPELVKSTLKALDGMLKDAEGTGCGEGHPYDTFAASQAVVNAELSAKVRALTKTVDAYKNDWETLTASLNCRGDDVLPALANLISKYRRLKEANKVLNAELLSIPLDGASSLREMVENQREEIARLSIQLKKQMEVLSEAENGNISLKQEMEAERKLHKEETAQYEKSIASRNRACLELSSKVNELESKNEGLALKLSQKEEELSSSMASQKKLHEQQVAALVQEVERIKKISQNRYEKQKHRYNNRVSNLKTQYDDDMKRCDAANDAAKREIEELQQMCTQLKDSLKQSEENNAALIKKLTKAKRNLTVLATAIDREREQAERDKKVVEVQHACQMMQAESKHHEEVIAAKNTSESKAEELKIKVLEAFDLLDSFEQREIDDESFEVTLRRLAHTFAALKNQ